MANCPNPACGLEFVPSPDRAFCDGCGKPLAPPRASSRQQENVTTSDPVAAAGSIAAGVPSGRTIGVGVGNTAGHDVVIQNTVQQQFCPIGGELIVGNRFFGCPKCNRSPLCDQHFDVTRRLCEACIEQQSIPCSICNERVPSDETFTCSRCHRIVGNDHLDEERGWCSDCVDRWAGIVQSIENDEVAIDGGGNVVTRGDVELKDGILRTKDGKAVATIKETTGTPELGSGIK